MFSINNLNVRGTNVHLSYNYIYFGRYNIAYCISNRDIESINHIVYIKLYFQNVSKHEFLLALEI